ncbi:MAG: hypothetical protein IPK60_09210 [Sandaracinaceae bacterium]|nr:hypothetical protein [Sandaracinaceae bacterium]
MTSLRAAPYLLLIGVSLTSACSTREGTPMVNTHVDSGVSVDASTIDSARIDSGVPFDASIACSDALDIVFVLDVSTSMGDVLGDIRAGITDIWNTATGLSANAQFGMVVFVDDAVAVNDCTPIGSVAQLQAQFDHWRDFCSSNESPLSHEQNVDCEENSLDAVALAVAACPWRTPATRIIVHVTDDTFEEHPYRLSDSVTVGTNYADVAATLVSEEIRFAVFANQGTATCGSYSGAPGFHTPFMSQPSLPTQTGGRAWDLDQVRSDTLNMGTAISDLLRDEYCTLFLF